MLDIKFVRSNPEVVKQNIKNKRLAVSAFILSILRCLQCLWRISQGLEVRLQTGFLD